jgi:hypothetical protein
LLLVLYPSGQLSGHLGWHDGAQIEFLPFICQIKSNGYLVAEVS